VALRFEDHEGFERVCLIAAAGGAVVACTVEWTALPKGLVPWAAAGAMAAWMIFVLGSGARRDEELPPAVCIAGAVVLVGGAGLLARSLPALVELLGTVLPAAGADALGGAVLGLWMGAATAPLHVRAGSDRVERRLAALTPRLDPELLRLAQRAAAARTELLRSVPSEVGPGMRRAADGLALAALDLAEQGTDASRAQLREYVDRLEQARDAF